MGISCSICKSETDARLVNELLFKGDTLDQISAATNFHRSSLHRHRTGSCRFSYIAYKSNIVKNKNRKGADYENSKVVVAWPPDLPGGSLKYTYGGRELAANELSPADVVLRVEYQAVDIYRVGNPPALDNLTTRKLAEAEHQLRGFGLDTADSLPE